MTDPDPGSLPRLPVLTLNQARPFLQAPLTGDAIGVFARRSRRDPNLARIVFHVPIRYLESLLNTIFGLGRWRRGEPTALDDRTLSCSLIVLGGRFSALGQGRDRKLQSDNGTITCALHLGVGAFIAQIPPLRLPIGDGDGKIALGPDNEPLLTEPIEKHARDYYREQITLLREQFGPPLELPRTRWDTPPAAAGRARGLVSLAGAILEHAGQQPATPLPLRSALGALSTRIARRTPQSTTPAPAASAPDARGPQVVEIDFAEVGPPPRRWAA